MSSNEPIIRIPITRLSHSSGIELPAYATPMSAGVDLYAAIDSSWEISPGDRAIVPCGIAIELPEGYEAQIRPRSGLAVNHGITVLNSPGTIDADYRGEIKVVLINLSKTSWTFKRGQRIAQMVISRHARVEWAAQFNLGHSSRGPGGFGSTGN